MAKRLLCIYQHAPTPGAPGIYRHRLYLSELVRRGWHVDLISTPVNYMQGTVPPRYAGKPYVREVIAGIHHHWVWALPELHRSRLHRAMNYISFAATATLRAATLPRPDVIWASSPPLPVGTLGELLSLRFGRPWILEVRDLWPESAVSVGWLSEDTRLYRFLDAAARRYSSRADGVLVPTPGLAEPVRGHGAPVVHVVSGAVLDAARGPEVRTRIRAELGASEEDTCLFVYVGAFGVANGLQILLDAAATVNDAGVRARFLLVGDGSDRRRLEDEVRRRQIPGVEIRGAMPKDQVPDILAAGDVCLHVLRPDPVFESALPSKVLEYLGAHRPFITTVPGLPARLAADTGGGFAPSLDALVSELRRWAAMTPGERLRRGDEAFAIGVRSFGLEASVDRLEAMLAGAMRNGSGPPPAH
jgi:colanic acid biosynthesis glycosyl transferase WcaI